jgi:hypothetical protein
VVRTGLVSPLLEAREVIARFPGTARELLALVIHGWWERIGNTALAGIPKLIMAEASNFPEIARFYFEEVIQPGQATMAAVIQRGIDSGEFRAVNALHAAHLLTAPFLLIGSWRTSLAGSVTTSDPRFLDAQALLGLHLDVLTRGLANETSAAGLAAPAPKQLRAAAKAARKPAATNSATSPATKTPKGKK